MAIVKNVGKHAVILSSGLDLGPLQTANADPAAPNEAAMLAAGILIITDGSVAPSPPASPPPLGIPGFQAFTRYPAGYVIIQANALYQAVTAFTSTGSFSAGDWTAVTTGLPSSVGSGSSFAASFGVSTASSDNTAAVNAAITAAYNAGGLDLKLPSGVLTCLGRVILKGKVMLSGQHTDGTTLYFPTDLGAGVAGLDTDDTTFATQRDSPIVRDIHVKGNGTWQLPSVGAGTYPAMDGVRAYQQCIFERVSVTGFRAGWKVAGGVITWRDCNGGQNQYGADWDIHPGVKSGFTFEGQCSFAGNQVAGWLVAGDNQIDACQGLGSIYLGLQPYGILGDDQGVTSSEGGLISNSHFAALQMEGIGNCAIKDRRTTPDVTIQDTLIEDFGFSWGVQYKIAAEDRNYAIQFRIVGANVEIREHNSAPPTVATTGDGGPAGIAAYFLPTLFGPIVIDGFARTSMFDGGGLRTKIRNSWYEAEVLSTYGTIAVGDYVMWNGADLVQRYYPDSAAPPILGAPVGVALTASIANFKPIIVAVSGVVPANVDGAVQAGGLPLVPNPSAGGHLIVAPNYGPALGSSEGLASKEPIVAVADGTQVGSGTLNVRVIPPRNDRNLSLAGTIAAGSLPTASAYYRGQTVVADGGGSVADLTYICLKNADGSYSWLNAPSKAPTWTTLTPIANIAAVSGYQAPRYAQDPLGFVHIEGTIVASGAVAANTALFSTLLPSAMRPATKQAANVQSLASYELYVDTDGGVKSNQAIANGQVYVVNFLFWPVS